MPPGLLQPDTHHTLTIHAVLAIAHTLPYSTHQTLFAILTLLIPGAGGSARQRRRGIFGLAQSRRALAAPSHALTPSRHSHYPRRTQVMPGARHAGPQWTAGPQDPRLTLRTAVQVGGIEPALPHVMRAMPLTPLPALLPSPPALTATLCRTSQPLYAVWPRPSAIPNNTRPRLFTPPPYQIPPTLPPAHRWRLGVRRRHTRVGEARVLRSCRM